MDVRHRARALRPGGRVMTRRTVTRSRSHRAGTDRRSPSSAGRRESRASSVPLPSETPAAPLSRVGGSAKTRATQPATTGPERAGVSGTRAGRDGGANPNRPEPPAPRRIHTACFVEQRGPDHGQYAACTHVYVYRVGLLHPDMSVTPLPGDFRTPRQAINYADAIEAGGVRLGSRDERTCDVCGKALPLSARADCRTCSASCRVAGARARKSDESRNPAVTDPSRSLVTASARPGVPFLKPPSSRPW